MAKSSALSRLRKLELAIEEEIVYLTHTEQQQLSMECKTLLQAQRNRLQTLLDKQKEGPTSPRTRTDFVASSSLIVNREEINCKRKILDESPSSSSTAIVKWQRVEENKDSSQDVFVPLSFEEIALEIPVVLDVIIKYLNLDNLKTCRLINPTWNRVVSKYLLRQSDTLYSPLCFKYSLMEKEFIFESSKYENPEDFPSFRERREHSFLSRRENDRTMTDLVNCLKESKKSNIIFPFSSFHFIGGDLNPKDQPDSIISQFFSLHGEKIKTFAFEKDPCSCDQCLFMDEDSFLDLLMNKIPNVVTMKIGHFPQMSSTNWDSFADLPNLKSLTCLTDDQQDSTAFAMLGQLPKLERLYNFKPFYSKWFKGHLERTQCIKQVRFIKLRDEWFTQADPSDNDWLLEQLEDFSQFKTQLDYLIIPYDKEGNGRLDPNEQSRIKQLASTLTSVLESSKDSLKILELASFSPLPDVRFPSQFKNVTKLRLLDCREDWLNDDEEIQPLFPRRCTMNLSQIFPNLSVVIIDFFPFESIGMREYLPGNEIIPCLTVQQLTVVYSGVTHVGIWYARLARYMPNVLNLIVLPVRQLGSAMEAIYGAWPGLTDIEVKLSGYYSLQDSELSGIRDNVISLLRSSSGQFSDYPKWPHDFRYFKSFLSVPDFEDLRRFKITIINKYLRPNKLIVPCQVTGQVFQNLSPELQVTIGYNQKCPSAYALSVALRSIAPYVKLVHVNNEEDLEFFSRIEFGQEAEPDSDSDD